MKEILEKEFGLTNVEIKKIDGYDNHNYLIKMGTDRVIFKTYVPDDALLSILHSESEVLLYLHKDKSSKYPQPIPFADGDYIKTQSIDKKPAMCRMLSFLDGDFLGDVNGTITLYQSLGTFLAEMDLKLQSIDHPILRARQWEWDIQYLHLNKKYLNDIKEPRDRSLVRYFFQQFEENVVPILPGLRKQVIHNDANEWNVLVKNDAVTGIIDFGDLAYAPLVNEMAVAMTYVIYDKEEPLAWVPALLKAYHEVIPLKAEELAILYYLVAARLCVSVCNSAHAKQSDPDNSYATVSEAHAWSMLRRWLSISPKKAENTFRKAVGWAEHRPQLIEKLISLRHQHISPILSLSYDHPIAMERAAFQYMYDSSGNCFLDAYNNIPHVGHSHPKVIAAGQRQMARLNTNTRYVYDLLAEYAEKLLSKFPDPLNKVYFVNSGSAASDLAIRLAQAHTRHEQLMVMAHGYHGNTQMAIDVSDYKFNNPKGQGQKGNIAIAELPDTYRGRHSGDNAGHLYAVDAARQINASQSPIAAFIAEPIVGCGGQVPLANGYLEGVYKAIRAQGGICISDEVQTGFGRLGDHFWGFEAQNVVPDVVILGKPMGNGHPIGAVITTDEVAESFEKGVEFFSSFGGNPVSCAIGLSVLEVMEEEQLQEHTKHVGKYYQSLLKGLQKKHACIGDVRGSGLFLGVDIVETGTQNTDRKLAHHIKNELRQRHILISTDGPDDNVLKTKPPLCFSKENAEEVVEVMDEVLFSTKTRIL